MKVDELDLCGGVRAAFPFACPWRADRELPETMPLGSVVRRVEPFDDGDNTNGRIITGVLALMVMRAGRKHYRTGRDDARGVGDDSERYAALADVLGDDDATMEDLCAAFFSASRDAVRSALDDAESALLAESFQESLPAIEKALKRYYHNRAGNVDDAVSWCVSELYSSVIDAVLRGRLAVPANASQWIGSARKIRGGYWKANQLVVDGQPVALFGFDDTNNDQGLNLPYESSHRDSDDTIRVSRLRLDNEQFACHLVSLYELGAQCDNAPGWVVDSICLLVEHPTATQSKYASIRGVTVASWKRSLVDIRKAIRFGALLGVLDC